VTRLNAPARTGKAVALPFVKSGAVVGPSQRLDPRRFAYRADLADLDLVNEVGAQRYAATQSFVCQAAAASVRQAPNDAATQVSELLFGETFLAVERGADWSWGYVGVDRYVGYVPSSALTTRLAAATHWISAPQALLFSAASIKSPILKTLPQNAQLALGERDGAFFPVLAEPGSFVHHRHVRALGDWLTDPVEVAAAWLGAPYLWGGRTRSGCDCSGLVQAALLATGRACPRDSDQQQAALGEPIRFGAEPLRRGDLVFVPGHVGVMADETRLLHANAHHMAVTLEPLTDVLGRLAEPEVTVRRLV
jgi:cell wall-associated NlpC family hydrolase